LCDVEILVPQYALNGGVHLALVEHEGLGMEYAPTGQNMAIDTDRRGLSAMDSAYQNPEGSSHVRRRTGNFVAVQSIHVGSRIRARASDPYSRVRFAMMLGPITYFAYGVIANMPLAQSIMTPWIRLTSLLAGASFKQLGILPPPDRAP
jgi:hypothetical protein